MKMLLLVLLLAYVGNISCGTLQDDIKIVYPEVRRDSTVVDNYFGTSVPDPYRWLEIPDSAEVTNYIEKQDAITLPYLEACPIRKQLLDNLTILWDYPKIDIPKKHGDHYFHYANSGLENQKVLYVQTSLDGEAEVFLDPNKLSEDGTLAMSGTESFSNDGEIFAYGLSKSGSDWVTIKFRNVSTKQDFPEELNKVKFTDIIWTHDNRGVFYGQYPDYIEDPDGSETETNENQKIYYHRVGTSQADDVMVVEFLLNPKWIIAYGMRISVDGKYLIVTPEAGGETGEGAYADNRVYYAELEENITSKFTLIPVISEFNAKYLYITDDGSNFYFQTNYEAPNYRVVGINFTDLSAPWTVIVPENHKNVLNFAVVVNNDRLVVCYLEDVKSKLELWSLENGIGTHVKIFTIDVGTVSAHSGGRTDTNLFLQFESFVVPNRIYVIDFTKNSIDIGIHNDVNLPGFDPNQYVTKQLFYPSTNDTLVNMFIIHKKDFVLDGQAPAMLYGYGGFNINVQPSFSVPHIVFMEHFGGVVAIANLRGGGEYGNTWHEGGRLLNKQNVFDDFHAAAEYLIANNYTSTPKLIIEGRSNGGLLIGACVNQRPDLYGAALATVGVMDMLRFHKFTIGHAWVPEYGSSENAEQFEYIYKYSPLHNIRMNETDPKQYPAVLVLTSDHDDRVVPLHSYKYAAELQYQVGNNPRQTKPVLIRIERDAGHGAGKPTTKQIEEQVDIFSFLVQSLNLEVNGQNSGCGRLTMSTLAIFVISLLTIISLQ